jgi:hypothetical protein
MEDLFGSSKQLSRSEKMKISRKATTDLTFQIIKWLNDSGQFRVHRSNNFPGQRIVRKKMVYSCFNSKGEPVDFEYDSVEIFFKANNIKETILDISGFILPYNGNVNLAGKHLEIEVKTGKDSLSDGQIQRINDVSAAGGVSFVFDSMETFLIQIKKYAY